MLNDATLRERFSFIEGYRCGEYSGRIGNIGDPADNRLLSCTIDYSSPTGSKRRVNLSIFSELLVPQHSDKLLRKLCLLVLNGVKQEVSLTITSLDDL